MPKPFVMQWRALTQFFQPEMHRFIGGYVILDSLVPSMRCIFILTHLGGFRTPTGLDLNPLSPVN